VLRCTANDYDSVIGTETPYEGLAVVDLTQAAWTKTVGLGFERVVSVNAGEDSVYIASKVAWIVSIPLVSSLRIFRYPFDPVTGTGGSTANVPGAFVQYDPSTQVLVVRDDQWTAGYDYISTLRTASWTAAQRSLNWMMKSYRKAARMYWAEAPSYSSMPTMKAACSMPRPCLPAAISRWATACW